MVDLARPLLEHLEAGGSLGRFSLLLKRSWKHFLDLHRINGGTPKTKVHMQAILALHEVRASRMDIALRWDRQMVPLGAPSATSFGEKLEDIVQPFIESIENALQWGNTSWRPLQKLAAEAGVEWSAIDEKARNATLGKPDLERLRATLANLREEAIFRLDGIKRRLLDERFRAWKRYVSNFAGNNDNLHVVCQLRTAIETQDPTLYASARRRLVDLISLRDRMARRSELLRRLETTAPAWAAAIRNRLAPHGEPSPPGGDLVEMWKLRQWTDQLDSRQRCDLNKLQTEIIATRNEIFAVSAQYVEKKAWLAQIARTGQEQQRALGGWLNLQKKLGAGHTKRKAVLLAEGRDLLSRCREAVPVWILLSRPR
jgi:hypothetical protein